MVMLFPTVLMLVLVALIVVIMNIAGLEMATNRDLDWNREFRAAGLASVVAGLGGGTPASLIVPASLRSKLFGAATRLTGIVAALVIAAALFLGDGGLELIPVSLVGGILFFAGLGMLDQGLVRSRKRLPWTEYGVVVLIAGVTVTFGLFRGGGRRVAGHPRVLRRAPEPCGPGQIALHGAGTPEHQGALGSGSRHPPGGGRARTGVAATRLRLLRKRVSSRR